MGRELKKLLRQHCCKNVSGAEFIGKEQGRQQR